MKYMCNALQIPLATTSAMPASVLPELQVPRGDLAWSNSTVSPEHPRKEAQCPSKHHSTVTLDANLRLVTSLVQTLFRHRHPVFYKIRLNALTPFCCLKATELLDDWKKEKHISYLPPPCTHTEICLWYKTKVNLPPETLEILNLFSLQEDLLLPNERLFMCFSFLFLFIGSDPD